MGFIGCGIGIVEGITSSAHALGLPLCLQRTITSIRRWKISVIGC